MTSHDRGSHAGGPSELVPFTGRGRELAHLVEALERRVPRLILGPAGIGKTRLIGEALARARAPFVRLRHDGPLHKLLVDLALELGCRWPRFSDPRLETSLSLKGAILAALRAEPRCVVFDDIAGAEPRTYRFFQELYYIPGSCLLAAARSREALGHLRKLLWDPREEISLAPLDRTEACRLFDQAVRTFHLEWLELDEFRRQVLAAAQGNPGQIVAMCRLAGRPEYRNGRRVKFAPLRIDALTSCIR